MAKTTGIWIDKRIAKIVTLSDGVEDFQEINSSIEEFRPSGGSGTRLKGGPQDVVQDSKYTEREKQQEKAFFTEIVDQVRNTDQLVIFGPAQTGEKLQSEIAKSYPDVEKKLREVKSADSMSDNQIKAWVRDYFSES